MTNNGNSYNFSELTSTTQRGLIALITGFYSGAHHFAKNNNIPLQIAELDFAKTCVGFSYSLSEEEIAEFAKLIDCGQITLFSSEMSEKIRDWTKAQATAAQEADDDEDFSFIDEDDLIDFLCAYADGEDIEAGEADE